MAGETVYRNRPWWLGALLRGPGNLASRPARVAVTVMIAGGAVCTVGSGVLHLYLWGKQYGYRDIPNHWLDALKGKSIIEALMNQLEQLGLTH